MSTENQKIDIILDCDPGYDDAAAILLAAGNPNVNILAITVVAGNQSIAKVTRNALAIAQVAGLHDVPIAAGAPKWRPKSTVRRALTTRRFPTRSCSRRIRGMPCR